MVLAEPKGLANGVLPGEAYNLQAGFCERERKRLPVSVASKLVGGIPTSKIHFGPNIDRFQDTAYKA